MAGAVAGVCTAVRARGRAALWTRDGEGTCRWPLGGAGVLRARRAASRERTPRAGGAPRRQQTNQSLIDDVTTLQRGVNGKMQRSVRRGNDAAAAQAAGDLGLAQRLRGEAVALAHAAAVLRAKLKRRRKDYHDAILRRLLPAGK